ncbi:cysteine-rich repeat secretory protein 38-like [Gastrolobium bilobum]|uniref:cysteine-rich repeat secretory protein 38-like n=1 Tax=Gastrolobium bilobum TaxID=150636 RepID=UPI002AB054E8|nr:cysteine-rich repeat secretory protein 38-like [Gastrolobium bilobum]
MSSSKLFTIILFSLTLSLILQTSSGANPLFRFCSSSEYFSQNSPYESYLKRLSNSLIYSTPQTGFSVSIAGKYRNQHGVYGLANGVYGLALCRGDVSNNVSTLDCKTCVSEATKEIRSLCPYNKGAIIWYDYCMFKYLDTKFFGYIDKINTYCYTGIGNSGSDPATFYYKTKKFLNQLAEKASVNPKLYATGELKIEESEKLYGLTQCTKDLSRSDCKKCLDDIINPIPNCWEGAKGGRILGGSCNFRYETYPFFKE